MILNSSQLMGIMSGGDNRCGLDEVNEVNSANENWSKMD